MQNSGYVRYQLQIYRGYWISKVLQLASPLDLPYKMEGVVENKICSKCFLGQVQAPQGTDNSIELHN